jgi:N-methylhydantoinase B
VAVDAGFYVPSEDLKIDPTLRLSSDFEDDIDAITYEVIRHNLWNINEEHGVTMANVSGSPVAVYAHDFNPSILTERGEFVYFGPYIQFFSGMTDLMVKWVLTNRSTNPGINEGDMFLSNDPMIGTHHQSDVFLLCPVFWEGELFSWTANALHQYDIGGNTPGSFCVDARDVFDEPTPIPPIKIVEGGELRADVVDMYLRHSRLPQIMGLDLRAQIAGNNVSRDGLYRLISRYGPEVVKGVMRKILDDAERGFLAKLDVIPDGEWKARGYLETAFPGDRNVYEARMCIRKEGNVLTFDNEGTDDQTGSLNTSFAGWRGGILAVLNSFLCFDMLFAVGGALRHLRFEPVAGTILSVVHPGATSCAPAFGTQMAIDLAHECMVKMISTAPSLRAGVVAPGGHSQTALVTLHGIDQRGAEFGTILTDHLLGSVGAFSTRDGVSTGGLYWDPFSVAPNVEFNEQSYPILTLYRRETPDSGGAGVHRGGNSASMAFISHHTDNLNHVLIGAGVAVPSANGVGGGLPGGTSWYRYRNDTDVLEMFTSGYIPSTLDELKGGDTAPLPKTELRQSGTDVFEIGFTGSGGYGDSIERLSEEVEADIEAGSVSEAAARAVYMVEPGDPHETERLRQAERDRRLALQPSDEVVVVEGLTLMELSEHVVIINARGRNTIACAKCRAALASAGDDYKSGCIREDLPLTNAGPRVGNTEDFIDTPMQFRCFYCPSCGRRLATEIARADDDVLDDVRLVLP